nr:alpha-(1,3)-fucosyltransferase 7-like [Paramormyrops kingsleyae]
MAAGRNRKTIFLALILTFILSKYVIYQWFMKWFNDRSRLGTEREDIRVLMWHWPFEQNQTLQEDICRTKYHVGGCHLVDNRSLYHQADVVVFHNRKLQTGISRLPLDQPRPTAQKWVWLSLESPSHNGDLRAKKPLDSDQLLPTISRCYFYLAFENSVYRDYITEKLWNNALLAGSVPVVLGPPRANYEAFIPKDSFIHVDDFNSIKELADFLNQLASDKERYESYFRWRRDYDVQKWPGWRDILCRICGLYEHLPSTKVYHNLEAWANGEP